MRDNYIFFFGLSPLTAEYLWETGTNEESFPANFFPSLIRLQFVLFVGNLIMKLQFITVKFSMERKFDYFYEKLMSLLIYILIKQNCLVGEFSKPKTCLRRELFAPLTLPIYGNMPCMHSE
jgi:hypothetical protein